MKLDKQLQKILNIVIGSVLAITVALSSVGCLITAFELHVDSLPLFIGLTAAFAVGGAIGFSFRYGPFAVLGGAVGGLVAAWLCGGIEQTQLLITRLSYTYDQAYQWGVIRFSNAQWYGVPEDIPLTVAACLIALTVTWAVCRRRPAIVAVAAAIIPFSLCVVVTDTIPAWWCFLPLLAGLVILLISAHERRRDPDKAPQLTVMTTVAVTVALALLVTAVPQKGFRNPLMVYQNQLLTALGFEGYSAGTGTIDGVDLQGLGSRFFLQYPVMTVTSSQDGRLYLRERDYNIYTGYSWESDDKRADRFEVMASEQAATHLEITTEWQRAQLMVPYYPTESVLLGDGREWNSAHALTYEWDVQTLPENWRDMIPNDWWASSMEMDSLDMRYYHSLPTETYQWAEPLLYKILSNAYSATAKADAIADYVRNSALYEDDCKRMPTDEEDFAEWFLRDGESGYCVHFATATAVLLRAAGVPSRYVSGYMVDAVANEPTVITADLEHAWVEYYEPMLGVWIPLESTPEEIEEEEETTTTLPPYTTSPSDDTLPTNVPIPSPSEDGPRFEIPWKAVWAVTWRTVSVLGAIAGLIALVIGQRRIRLATRRKRLASCEGNARALQMWRYLQRLYKRAHEDATDTLYALAQKAAYSQHELTASEHACFTAEVDRLCARLRTKPWYKRFVYTFILCLY